MLNKKAFFNVYFIKQYSVLIPYTFIKVSVIINNEFFFEFFYDFSYSNIYFTYRKGALPLLIRMLLETVRNGVGVVGRRAKGKSGVGHRSLVRTWP